SRADVGGRHRLRAVWTGEEGHPGVAAAAMDQLDGGPGFARHPVVAPVQQRNDHRIQVASLLGEPVLVAWRPLLVADALQHAGADEPSQPIGKPVAAQADGLEALEATGAEKGVAQDEKRPPVAAAEERLPKGALHTADVSQANE